MKSEINVNNLDEELDETLYVVQWHMGGLSITPEDIGYNVCDQCGDVDVSSDGSNTIEELLLEVIDGIKFNTNEIDEIDFINLKNTLSDEGFELNMTLLEVNAYIQGEN